MPAKLYDILAHQKVRAEIAQYCTKPYKKSSLVANNDQRVGLEFEWEGVPPEHVDRIFNGDDTLPDTLRFVNYFQYDSDGSLRNHGAEFRTRGGIIGSQIPEAISIMYAMAEFFGWEDSIRTSVHVHVDFNTRTALEVVNTLTAYALIEPALFAFVGQERECNPYCMPLYQQDYQTLLDAERLYNSRNPHRLENISRRKYSAVSAATLQSLGTLEFRAAPIQNELQTRRWVNMLIRLANLPSEFKTPVDLVSRYLETSGANLAQEILGVSYKHLPLGELAKAHKKRNIAEVLDLYETVSVAERIGGCPADPIKLSVDKMEW